ncbi:unnamed protein product [Notodromas monacha]|uniref:Uncharacterized protein n=1 Tax=Notodromas monacha TaxID=399045 RepID=A0A7R9BD60_9CRUS|nr:unnamed protein product [Notodromas monacha]CAG0912329.1 unnamed protein product [Notodromas monacha]
MSNVNNLWRRNIDRTPTQEGLIGVEREGSGSDREGSSVPNIRMPLTPNPSTRCSSGIRPVIPPLTPRGSRADKDHMMVQMRLEEMTTEDRSSCSEDNDDDDVTVRFNGVRLPARESQKCGSSTSTRDSGVSSASCRERMRGPDTPHHSSLRSVHSKDETKYHDARSKHEPPERKKSVTFRAANVHDSRRMSSTEKLLPLEDPDDRLQRQKMRLHDAAQLPTRLQHVSLESSSEDEEYEVQSDDEEEDDEDEEDDRYLNKSCVTGDVAGKCSVGCGLVACFPPSHVNLASTP